MPGEGDVMEVTPEVIDPPARRTAIDGLVERAVRLEGAIKRGDTYSPHEIVSYEDCQQSKRERTALRKDIKAITDERASLFRRVEEQKQRIHDALVPADEAQKEYKRRIDEYEKRLVADRLNEAAEFYADFAPDLVPLVPFERIDAKYGRDRKWHNLSTSVETIKEDVQGIVEDIAEHERHIKAWHFEPQDEETLTRLYFDTLDFDKAAAQAQHEKEQREAMARLQQERADRQAMAGQQENPETPADASRGRQGQPKAPHDGTTTKNPTATGEGATEPHRAPRVGCWRVRCSEEHAQSVIRAMRVIPTCTGEFLGWDE